MTEPVQSILIPLQNACDRSADLDFLAQIEHRDGRWFMCNRAGIVAVKGPTFHDMCINWIGNFEVIR